MNGWFIALHGASVSLQQQRCHLAGCAHVVWQGLCLEVAVKAIMGAVHKVVLSVSCG